MDCREVIEQDVIEEYVAGRLGEDGRDAFEAHFFECASCFGRLEACQALRGALIEQRRKRPAHRVRAWAWPLAAAAAVAVVAVVLHTPSASPPPGTVGTSSASPEGLEPQARLALLGRFEAPRYALPTLRGASILADERFRSGMARYAAGDYQGAIPDLRAAAAGLPDSAGAHFFLGIALVLARDVDGGVTSLARVVELGDTPFLEPAHFYLAKALLLKGDPAAAEVHLRKAIALRGDLEARGRDLLQRIENVPRVHDGF